MKRLVFAMASILALGISFSSAQSASFTFMPYDTGGNRADVFDLDHNYLYLWGIDATRSAESTNLKNALDSGKTISSATILIKDIYNWDYNKYALKFFLLENVNINDNNNSVDIISIKDYQGITSIYEIPHYDDSKFQDYSKLAEVAYNPSLHGATPTPIPGPSDKTFDFRYDFDAAQLTILTQYINSANNWGTTTYRSTFGIGFDPDCHFFNDGITLTITTHTPEPATMLLLGSGLFALVAGRKRRLPKPTAN